MNTKIEEFASYVRMELTANKNKNMDYKDNSELLYDIVSYWWGENKDNAPSEMALVMNRMPDGYSCPRSFWKWYCEDVWEMIRND